MCALVVSSGSGRATRPVSIAGNATTSSGASAVKDKTMSTVPLMRFSLCVPSISNLSGTTDFNQSPVMCSMNDTSGPSPTSVADTVRRGDPAVKSTDCSVSARTGVVYA
jgi:hypothetical protein